MKIQSYILSTLLITSSLCANTPTLSQKIGQLFMIHTNGETLTEESKTLIEETSIGNIIYFNWANNLTDKSQVRQLSQQIHEYITKATGFPPLIAIDQEGGPVQRLRFREYPGNKVLGDSETTVYAQGIAREMGEELRALGINMNLAPVVDIAHEGSYINKRSFGSDPAKVTEFANAMIQGFHQAGIKTCLKHFPGLGDSAENPHTNLARINNPGLEPFIKLKDTADAIMSAHVIYPQYDQYTCSTLSYPVITGLLRNQIGYQGLVITDSLSMNGVLEGDISTFSSTKESVRQAARKAILAGCDLLILGRLEWTNYPVTPEMDRELTRYVIQGIHDDVQKGRIPLSRIDESFKRVMNLKESIQMANSESYLSQDQIASFYESGYVVVKHAFDSQEVQRMSELANEVTYRITNEFLHGSSAKDFFELNKEYRAYLDGSQVVFKKTERGISILRVVGCGSMQPSIQNILRSDKMVNTYFDLLKTNKIEHIICQLHPKLPEDSVEFRAHRDLHHRQMFDPEWVDVTGQGSYAIAVIAVDPVTRENGGLWVDDDDYARLKRDPNRIRSIPSEQDQHRTYLEMEPGDMLLMHPHLLHGSLANNSQMSRRTLLTGFCVYGANHKNYPGNCTNDVLIKNKDGSINVEKAEWKMNDDPSFITKISIH